MKYSKKIMLESPKAAGRLRSNMRNSMYTYTLKKNQIRRNPLSKLIMKLFFSLWTRIETAIVCRRREILQIRLVYNKPTLLLTYILHRTFCKAMTIWSGNLFKNELFLACEIMDVRYNILIYMYSHFKYRQSFLA